MVGRAFKVEGSCVETGGQLWWQRGGDYGLRGKIGSIEGDMRIREAAGLSRILICILVCENDIRISVFHYLLIRTHDDTHRTVFRK